ITPSSQGAARRETMDGVAVERFRYAPSRLETLIHNGGIVANLHSSPWKWLLLPSLLVAMLCAYCVAVVKFKPNLIHAHWLVPAGAVASLLTKGTPLVVTAHGSDVSGLNGFLWRKIR